MTAMATAATLETSTATSAGSHVELRLARQVGRAVAGDGLDEHDQPRPVGEERLELDPVDQLGDAVLHLAGAEHRISPPLDLVVGEAVAGELHRLVGDQGDRLGLAQPQAAARAGAAPALQPGTGPGGHPRTGAGARLS